MRDLEKKNLREIEQELVTIMSEWDPNYLEGPNVAGKIKSEIHFYGLDERRERLFLEHVDEYLERLLQLVRKYRRSHHQRGAY